MGPYMLSEEPYHMGGCLRRQSLYLSLRLIASQQPTSTTPTSYIIHLTP